jgi:hypothetical protein
MSTRMNCLRRVARQLKAYLARQGMFALRFLNMVLIKPPSSTVALHLSYRGPEDAPLDTANLRRALDLFTGAEEMSIEWNSIFVAPSTWNPPTLPATSFVALAKPQSSNMRTLTLNISNGAALVPETAMPGPHTRPVVMGHLRHLLLASAIPSLEELDLKMQISGIKTTVPEGLSVFVTSLEGVRLEGLKRLGIEVLFEVGSQKEITENWVRFANAYLFACHRSRLLAPCVEETARPSSARRINHRASRIGNHRPYKSYSRLLSLSDDNLVVSSWSHTAAGASCRYAQQVGQGESGDQAFHHPDRFATCTLARQKHSTSTRICSRNLQHAAGWSSCSETNIRWSGSSRRNDPQRCSRRSSSSWRGRP